MSQAPLLEVNALLHPFANATEHLISIVNNEPVAEERWSEDAPLGSEILCAIYATYATIISVGLLGNVILIKVFFKIKSMQTVPNIFITSLAFGDLLLLLTCVPVDAACYIVDTWLFGRIGCKLLSFIQRTSVGVSVFTLTVLSADRYKAIVKPLELQRADAVLKTCFKAACVWITSMLLAVPEAVSSDLYSFHVPEKNGSFETCAPYPVTERILQEAHSLICFLMFYIIPLAIISVYYFLIAKTLYKSTSNMPAEEHSHARKQRLQTSQMDEKRYNWKMLRLYERAAAIVHDVQTTIPIYKFKLQANRQSYANSPERAQFIKARSLYKNFNGQSINAESYKKIYNTSQYKKPSIKNIQVPKLNLNQKMIMSAMCVLKNPSFCRC